MTRRRPMTAKTKPGGNLPQRGNRPARLEFRLKKIQHPLLRSRQSFHIYPNG